MLVFMRSSLFLFFHRFHRKNMNHSCLLRSWLFVVMCRYLDPESKYQFKPGIKWEGVLFKRASFHCLCRINISFYLQTNVKSTLKQERSVFLFSNFLKFIVYILKILTESNQSTPIFKFVYTFSRIKINLNCN